MTVSVTVRNSGNVAGHEVVMLYITEMFAYPELEFHSVLKRFHKVYLLPNEAVSVQFTLSGADFRYLLNIPENSPPLQVKVADLVAAFVLKSELGSIALSEPDILPEVSTTLTRIVQDPPVARPSPSDSPEGHHQTPQSSQEPSSAASPRTNNIPPLFRPNSAPTMASAPAILTWVLLWIMRNLAGRWVV